MITNCPECDTHFRVTADQLKAAGGNVRCSHCQSVFSALENLRDLEGEAPSPQQEITFDEMPDLDAAPTEEIELAAESLEPIMNPETVEVPAALAEDMAELEASRKGRLRGLLWFLGSLLLGAGLAAQTGYFLHDQLVYKPQLKPWIEAYCQRVGCDISPPRQARAIEIKQRTVSRHPNHQNVLSINLAMENGAPFDQPYPILRISFADVGGNTVARRYFAPESYLQSISGSDLMPRETPIMLRFDVIDPGPQAVSYQFDFL